MTTDSSLDQIASIKADLQQLQVVSLPAEAAAALQKVQRSLEELSDRLVANDELSRLAALYRVSHLLGTSLELDEVLDQVMDAVIALTRAERGFLLLLEPGTRALSLRSARHFEQGDIQEGAAVFSQTVVQAVLQSDKGLVTTDAQIDPCFSDLQSVIFSALRSVLCAPLRARGQTIGVIYVDNHAQKDRFAARDLDLLETFAAHSAIAIENARLYQAVQRANEAKSKFVSVVTHELRTPMTSIKGYSDLLMKGLVGPVNEQQINFLGIIRNNIERMAALVSDLSDIARIEAGRIKLELAAIPLHGYIDETLRRLRPKFDDKKHNLTVDLPTSLPPAFADPNRLVQILTNLLSNACKYTPAGGQITVRTHLSGDYLRLEVSDSGIGIQPADQAQIFTQFFRSEDPNVRQETGWGLGLHVTKRLVEVMHGQIGFSSTFGQGSTFWFTLPVSASIRIAER